MTTYDIGSRAANAIQRVTTHISDATSLAQMIRTPEGQRDGALVADGGKLIGVVLPAGDCWAPYRLQPSRSGDVIARRIGANAYPDRQMVADLVVAAYRRKSWRLIDLGRVMASPATEEEQS